MQFKDLFVFDKMVAPTVIKYVYWIGLAINLITALGFLILSFTSSGYGSPNPLTLFLIAIATLFLGSLLWRVSCEIILVVFKINDALQEIRKK